MTTEIQRAGTPVRPTSALDNNEELRRTVAVLDAECDRLGRLCDTTPIAYITTSVQGRVSWSNRAARKLFGDELDGAMLASFVADDDVAKLTISLRESSGPWALEMVVKAATGDVPVRVEATPTPDEQVQLTLVDITAEVALRRQLQYAKRLREVAGVIILSLDASGKILHYNRFMEDLSGIPLAEAKGKSWFDLFIHGRSRELARALFERSVREGVPVDQGPSVLRAPDGSERMIQWRGRALEVRDHRVTAMLYVGIDVTETVARRREARAERERNRAILESAPDGIGIITITQSGEIESYNPGAERLFGYPASEAIGMNVADLMPPPDAEQLSRQLGGSGPVIAGTRELSGLRKDGSTIPLDLSIAEIQIDHRRSFCCFVRDLTESRAAEARLRQAHKLEAVGTLASGVAHDFNNLLMGVGGCADVALGRLDPDSEIRPFIEEIRRSAKSGAAITKQLLAFTSRGNLETTVFEVNEVIERSEGMLRRLLGEDVEVELDLRAKDSRIRSDIGQIEQVLMNLTVNARDAMEMAGGGGKLSIETDLETVGGRRFVLLRVADTGTGMSEETRARLFDPFFSTKPSDCGTGLGLSVVYGIVSEAGGSIRVDSHLGQGTTFEVLLPHACERVTVEMDAVSLPSPGPGREINVLIAEDDAPVRLALRHYLETAGYRVLEATSGTAAIELIESGTDSIDLLLTDMVLPGSSGAAVARRLVAVMPSAQVLYMSAHSTEWLVKQGRLPPGIKTLHKPFGQAELLAAIEQSLESSTPHEHETVLLVDDDIAVRRSLGAALRELGHEVLEAATGAEALRLGHLHSRDIDALVVDAVLPKHMGVMVARELSATIPNLVVIYISGYARSVALQDELVGPGCLFLQKPVSAARLHQVIGRANRQRARYAGSVLLVADNAAARMTLAELLSDNTGIDVVTARSGAEALERISRRSFDLLLVDSALPDMSGDRLACQLSESNPAIAVVYMSDNPRPELTGGLHFAKPVDLEALRSAVLAIMQRGDSAAG